MKIHHLRNATFVIESGKNFILIDPMLSDVGELPTFTYFKHKPQKNPLVALPTNSADILSKVTHSLITHSQKLGIELLTHTDHLDIPGRNFLIENNIKVLSIAKDTKYLKKHGLNVITCLEFYKKEDFLDGKITAIPAKHGHSWMHNFMANGAGYFIELPNEPSIYISGDTVLTEDVKKVLKELKPDISVVAAGNASLDVGGDILMSLEELKYFIDLAPKYVIANHLEALNHCPITRKSLREELKTRNLSDKTFIPDDGEVIEIL